MPELSDEEIIAAVVASAEEQPVFCGKHDSRFVRHARFVVREFLVRGCRGQRMLAPAEHLFLLLLGPVAGLGGNALVVGVHLGGLDVPEDERARVHVLAGAIDSAKTISPCPRHVVSMMVTTSATSPHPIGCQWNRPTALDSTKPTNPV